MKNVAFSPPGRRGTLIGVLNALLAIGLTVLSFRYVQPRDCYRSCGGLDRTACPTGSCFLGEQKAGWPLPVFTDMPGGGSPTSGWGILGPEDLPDLWLVILDGLFYSILLWIVFYILQRVRRQALPARVMAATLPLVVVLAAALWLFYALFSYLLPVGRGRNLSIYVNTPTVTFSESAFYPSVSIPLGELIENYGEPDEVRLHPVGPLGDPTLHMVLHWDSLGMFVELPQVEKYFYTIKETTHVKMILFFKEGQVIQIAGEPLGEKVIPWKGYGDYVP